jgi:hypothetical protein
MARDDVKACKRCDGSGEEYRPEFQCNDGPWLDCIGCHGYGFEQSEWSLRHCAALLGESWRVGWPAIFRGDVEYHDMRELCDRDARKPFAWILRETGSTILLPDYMAEHPRDARAAFDVCRSVIRAQDDDARCYFWDGRALQATTADRLVERLAAEMLPAEEHAA